MTPSVGRIVHYRSYGSLDGEYEPACRAAVITEVSPPDRFDEPDTQTVSLCVLNPEGMYFNLDVRHDAEKPGGTWHWPERVE